MGRCEYWAMLQSAPATARAFTKSDTGGEFSPGRCRQLPAARETAGLQESSPNDQGLTAVPAEFATSINSEGEPGSCG